MYSIIGNQSVHVTVVSSIQKKSIHEFSDTAPVNSFPRNTTSNASDFQWVFDNQSNNWEVGIISFEGDLLNFLFAPAAMDQLYSR